MERVRLRGGVNRLAAVLNSARSVAQASARMARGAVLQSCGLENGSRPGRRLRCELQRLGREDSDLLIRLLHCGVRRKDGRFATGVIHLWHPEADRTRLPVNDALLEAALHSGRTRAQCGLSALRDASKPMPQPPCRSLISICPARPRILVITLRRLGDVLLTTRSSAASGGASTRQHWMSWCFGAVMPSCHGNPDIDRVITMAERPSIGETLALIRGLFRRYDLVVCTQVGIDPRSLPCSRDAAGWA